jgi:large subunit ribosomal protein L3
MKFIIGKKVAMTQTYREDGRIVPVTVISAEPCVVTQIKSVDNDGYEAVQVATGNKRSVTKALLGHFKGLGSFRSLREFRAPMGQKLPEVAIGDKLDVTQFVPGDNVKVSGTTKGRGFQGVVKRWGFHGSPKTHGHKDQVRMPGSIGAGGVQHVFKGTRMGGRMGGKTSTVLNLEVIAINSDKNEILVKGAVPGAPNSEVVIIS